MTLVEAKLRAAAPSLLADAVTGEVASSLAADGVPLLLLRGPALRPILGERSYGDVDVLVPPVSLADAERVLGRLGFAPATSDRDFPLRGCPHAHEWRRASDAAAVDLHRTVSGAGASPQAVWDVLAEHAATVRAGGADVPCPAPAASALLVALHAAHHGPRVGRCLRDLRLALERVPLRRWREAAALARRIEAGPAFAAGLRLDPEGARVAAVLGLPGDRSPEVALRALGAPPPALGLLGLVTAGSWRTRARLLAQGLAPTPAALRHGRRLARRGALGLGVAYLTHPLWLLRHLPASVRAVRKARGEEAR
jgi:hypothetical protein